MATNVSEEPATSIFRLSDFFGMYMNLFATVLRLQADVIDKE
jgi:hypothetical protein